MITKHREMRQKEKRIQAYTHTHIHTYSSKQKKYERTQENRMYLLSMLYSAILCRCETWRKRRKKKRKKTYLKFATQLICIHKACYVSYVFCKCLFTTFIRFSYVQLWMSKRKDKKLNLRAYLLVNRVYCMLDQRSGCTEMSEM